MSTDFQAEAELVMSKGRWVVRKLIVKLREDASLPPQGLTVKELRSLRIADAVDLIRDRPSARRRTKSRDSRQSQRGVARDPRFYANVALAYLDALANDPDAPIAYMANHNFEGSSTNTVRSWVRAARTKGYLSEGKRGLAGAEPGPALRAFELEQQRRLERALGRKARRSVKD